MDIVYYKCVCSRCRLPLFCTIRDHHLPPKILHAEPLFVDLIRDLGARKGEREWNIGMGMVDKLRYDKYIALIEYEWAPIDRLGIEVEIPITLYAATANGESASKPSDRIESFKTAAQWSFLVQEDWKTTMAIGYLNELEFRDLDRVGKQSLFQGNLFNPFFVVAKRWGGDFHTLVYMGPHIHRDFDKGSWSSTFELNTNFHYMIPGSRNFIGLEINQEFSAGSVETVLRPQMRLVIHDTLMVGIVPGIPISKERERLSSFLRLIYEPRHKKH